MTDSALQIGNAVPIDLVKVSGKVFKEAIKAIRINRKRVRYTRWEVIYGL